MQTSAKHLFSKHWFPWIAVACFASTLFGVKLWLIATYGNATPFWDQWNGEAWNVYKPFLEGHLSFGALIDSHNEHRILTTRLLSLAELSLNGIWNPLLQMVVNAALHTGTLCFGIVLLTKVLGRQTLTALLAFSLLLFGIPYAWDNTLWGFQAQFYFVLLFSIACLWLTLTKRPLSAAWWGGVVCAVLAYFSLASGVFAIGAVTFTGALIYLLKIDRSKNRLVSILLLFGLFTFGLIATPTITHHASVKASSIHHLYSALNTVLSWPIQGGIIGACFVNLPGFIFAIVMLKSRPNSTDKRWFLFGLVIWATEQSLMMAYGRTTVVLISRYLDLYAVAVLINFACLLAIAFDRRHPSSRRTKVLVAIWVSVVIGALIQHVGHKLPAELDQKHSDSLTEEMYTRSYLATKNFDFLQNKPLWKIPFPDANFLRLVLNDPSISAILPGNIAVPVAPTAIEATPEHSFVLDGYYQTTPKINRPNLGSNGKALASNITYTPTGAIAGWVYGNGQSLTRTFDVDGRLQSFTLPFAITTGGNTSTVLGTRSITYDLGGQITALSDSATGSLSVVEGLGTQSFGYDGAGHLISATVTNRASLGNIPDQRFTYDGAGNRLSLTVTNAAPALALSGVEGNGSTNYVIENNSNRLNSFTPPDGKTKTMVYDRTGNIIQDGKAEYSFDARNRMTVARIGEKDISYVYNGSGQRAIRSKGGDVELLLFAGSGWPSLIKSSNSNTQQEIIYLAGQPIAHVLSDAACANGNPVQPASCATPTVNAVWNDQIGTPRRITDSSGKVVWAWDSTAFGESAANEDPLATGTKYHFALRFPGQLADSDTGLNQNYFRDYNPSTGRYVESDPIGLQGGVNSYAYVGGNPVQRIDPRGTVVIVDDAVVVAGLGLVAAAGCIATAKQCFPALASGMQSLANSIANACKSINSSSHGEAACLAACELDLDVDYDNCKLYAGMLGWTKSQLGSCRDQARNKWLQCTQDCYHN